MAQAALFGDDQSVGQATDQREARGNQRRTDDKPRVVTADRSQIELRPYDLDGLIRQSHPARRVWAFVEQLDLRKFYEPIKARAHEPGRASTDPKVLLALWLYATMNGVGSARELERLCQEHRLTTHGAGVEGALAAARKLAEAWVSERRAHGDPLPIESTALIGHIDLPDAVLTA